MNKTTTLLSLLLAACGTADVAPTAAPDVLALQQAAIPPASADFTLVTTAYVADAIVTLGVSDAPPNAIVSYVWGTGGLGDGDCMPALQNACVDFLGTPARMAVTALTNANGVATTTIRLPVGTELEYLSIQAVIETPNGPLTSNPVSSLVAEIGSNTDPTLDWDLDGFSRIECDCDDFNSSFNPDAPDIAGDGFDTNCDAVDGEDRDRDGVLSVSSGGTDCDDRNAAISPNAVEICDGIDNDCDGLPADFTGIRASVCDAIETFDATEAKPIDVLFVVEGITTMVRKQDRLADAFPAFSAVLEAQGVDAQIGVIATDDNPQTGGQLIDVGGDIFAPLLDIGAAATDAWFDAAVHVGGTGNTPGMARRTAWRALRNPLASTANAGFLRDDADLHVVFFSDQIDTSPTPSTADFSRGLFALKGNGYLPSVHAIVGPPNGCPTAMSGADYLRVVTRVGGIAGSACSADYTPTMLEIADEVLANTQAVEIYPLSQPTDFDQITVIIRDGLNGDVILGDDEVRWDPAENAVVLTGFDVPPGVTVEIRYNTP